MRLNSVKDVDPTQITAPILMNRKKPGPKEPPTFALDENGKIVGRYVYDAEGRPVLDADGQPVVERKEMVDMSLVGQASGGGTKRRVKRGTKEVFHQDIEIMRLRREEALPWVLESGNPQDKPAQPEQWVGRMLEQGQLSTVLLSNDGTRDGFELMPLGRSYKFEPARPFKPLDSDAANKLVNILLYPIVMFNLLTMLHIQSLNCKQKIRYTIDGLSGLQTTKAAKHPLPRRLFKSRRSRTS